MDDREEQRALDDRPLDAVRQPPRRRRDAAEHRLLADRDEDGPAEQVQEEADRRAGRRQR